VSINGKLWKGGTCINAHSIHLYSVLNNAVQFVVTLTFIVM